MDKDDGDNDSMNQHVLEATDEEGSAQENPIELQSLKDEPMAEHRPQNLKEVEEPRPWTVSL